MSLIIKPGGSFTHKSGASFGVKGSALPPYVIDGLEQSHWDMASAVVSSGRVTSVPDSSNVQALGPASSVALPVNPTYEASGWSLNGKTLPVARFIASSADGNAALQANTWATKISGYSGAYTVACLVKPDSSLTPSNSVNYGSAFGFGSAFPSPSVQGGPAWVNGQARWNTYRKIPSGASYKYIEAYYGSTFSSNHQLWVFQYDASASSALDQWKLWINGTLQTTYQGASGWTSGNAPQYGRAAMTPSVFLVGAAYDEGNTSRASTLACRIAQMHIWKGALTDEQRNNVTAYLKSISGIA